MDPTRWKRIEQVYHAALLRPLRERKAFLEHACAGDEELRREVETLLAQPSGDELQVPASSAGGVLADGAPGLIGRKIGSYLIDSRIGEGGMGEVYRARDTRLGRDVAIKVLPAVFATDPGRLARFEREARLLAALNHPRIATIHGFEELDGVGALVLELVEGSTLAERIARGPVGVDEALAIGQQIAEALEAAHDRGIIHRDLKPANVKVLPSGDVKVLDFGLAKALAGDDSRADVSHLPTVTATELTGLIVGTPAYMSPEQARGQAVDRRTDVWAFGCVLFNMLSGRRPFGGETLSDTIAAVLTKAPDWTALPAAVPPSVTRLIRRCLEKEPRRRLRDIGDARLEIEEAMTAPEPVRPSAKDGVSRRTAIGALAGAAASAVAIGVFTFGRGRNASGRDVMRFPIALPPGYLVTSSFLSRLAISPDGIHIACNAVRPGQSSTERAVASRGEVLIRSIREVDWKPLEGVSPGSPFFSPDGQWVGIVDISDGQRLRKYALSGGAPATIGGFPDSQPSGATWASNDDIYFVSSTPGGIVRVPGGRRRSSRNLSDRFRQRRANASHASCASGRSRGAVCDGHERIRVLRRRVNCGVRD